MGIALRLPVSQVPPGQSVACGAGARVLTADDPRERRDAVVRRIALAQRAPDGEAQAPRPAPPEPVTAPARPRRAPVVRPQPS